MIRFQKRVPVVTLIAAALAPAPALADALYYIQLSGQTTGVGSCDNSNVSYSTSSGLSVNLNGNGALNPPTLAPGLTAAQLTLSNGNATFGMNAYKRPKGLRRKS